MQQAVDTALPSLDLRALARRAALPAAVVVAAGVAVAVAGGPLRTFADALRRAVDADPRWVITAVVGEVLSFAGYVALLWLVARRATRRIGLRESAQLTFGGLAATRLLPTAGAGGAALTVWALRRAGLGARTATRTLLSFLVLLYAVFLAALIVTGTLLAVRGDAPLTLTTIPAVGAALVAAVALAGAALPEPAPEAGRARRTVGVLGGAVRDAIALVRSGDPRLLGALAWWGFDAAVLWAMLHAFGAPPAASLLILAYFVGQVANTIPVPGAASGGLVGVLLAFGVHAPVALPAVLAYRALAIWLPAPAGLAALAGLRGTLARWEREDATPAPAPIPIAAARRAAAPEPQLALAA